MLTVFDRSYDPIFPEFARKAYFQVAATMLFALLGERILTYYLFIEIKELMNAKEHPPSGTTLPSIFQKKEQTIDPFNNPQGINSNKKNNNNQNNNNNNQNNNNKQEPKIHSLNSKSSLNDSKISQLQKFGFFLLSLTYTDQFYYLYHHKQFKDEQFKRKYKNQQFYEYFLENIFFAGVALNQIHNDIYFFNKFTFIPVFSSIFSLTTCCIKTYQFIYDREINLKTKVSKSDIEFAELSNKAKLFTLSPFYFQCIKELQDKFLKYTEFHINNNSNNIHTNINKVPFYKKAFLFFYVIVGFCTLLIIICFCAGHELSLYTFRANFIAAIIGIPQVLLYLRIFIDTYKKKKKKNKIILKEILKVVLFYPIYNYGIANQLVFSVFVENVVFFSSIKETWVHNFYPSSLKIAIRQIMLTVILWGQFKLLDDKELKAPFLKQLENSEQIMERITKPDSTLRLFLNIGLYGFYILTILNILYFAEQFYYIYYKGIRLNKNKYQEKPINQEQEELKNNSEQLSILKYTLTQIPNNNNILNDKNDPQQVQLSSSKKLFNQDLSFNNNKLSGVFLEPYKSQIAQSKDIMHQIPLDQSHNLKDPTEVCEVYDNRQTLKMSFYKQNFAKF